MSDCWPTPSDVLSGSFSFILSVPTLIDPNKRPPPPSLRHVVCHYSFSYFLWGSHTFIAYLDFIKPTSHTFPDVPELLSTDRWGFQTDYFLTLPCLSSITSSSHSDYCQQKKTSTYFFSTQSFRGHSKILDIWPSNSCGLLVIWWFRNRTV